jgi:hypothetical protein
MMRLLIGGVTMLLVTVSFGCVPESTSAHPGSGEEASELQQRDEFAQDRAADAKAAPIAFDGKRAMKYLEKICAIGPRISGSEGMKKQQELVKKHFEEHGGKVRMQTFTAKQRSQKDTVEMANLIASWYPDRTRRIILCSHYDTRPIADQEENRRKWDEPFLSANDGGSGVALMMELAHHLKDLKTNVGVDFVLFDGEEYIFDPAPDHDRYFFGSDYFAECYRADRSKVRYIGAVLLDMIGGKNASFPVEEHSWMSARALTRDLWQIADELRCKAFDLNKEGPSVLDDHIALNRVGIPACDIIDFSYRHWHRLSDTPDNCSADSLEQVAKVLSVWLQRVK